MTTFEVPMNIPSTDKAAIRTAFALLTGDTAEVDAIMTATITANDTPQIRELVEVQGLIDMTGFVTDHQVEILGQAIQVGPVTVQSPPLQITGARSSDDGLALTVRTAPNHADQPVRLTRHNPADPESQGA
ncbi:hypothetical protein [Streptomyces sp. NPDC002516]